MLIPNGFCSLLDTCILLTYDNDPTYYQICSPFKDGFKKWCKSVDWECGKGIHSKRRTTADWIPLLLFIKIRLEQLEKRAVNDMFVILSDVWLDSTEVTLYWSLPHAKEFEMLTFRQQLAKGNSWHRFPCVRTLVTYSLCIDIFLQFSCFVSQWEQVSQWYEIRIVYGVPWGGGGTDNAEAWGSLGWIWVSRGGAFPLHFLGQLLFTSLQPRFLQLLWATVGDHPLRVSFLHSHSQKSTTESCSFAHWSPFSRRLIVDAPPN